MEFSQLSADKAEIRKRLQQEILSLQGFKPASGRVIHTGLGPVLSGFPDKQFPLGAVHEFVAPTAEQESASTGFISGLLSTLLPGNGAAAWICAPSRLFPPALVSFGVRPERILFIHLKKESDILWAMEEALKCSALSAVVAELSQLDFTASRRLQLAVETSKVTGFVLRTGKRSVGTTACVTRWQISPLLTEAPDQLPGLGFPRWKVELLKVRNGKPGQWDVEWAKKRFRVIEQVAAPALQRKVS